MSLDLDHHITQDLHQASQREWLETNGLGGWASSTICGANTRRYHGLLVAATRPPASRMSLLSKLDETLVLNEQDFELGCNFYPQTVHPQGFTYLHHFSKGLFPHWTYQAAGVELDKTVSTVHGENTTLVLYQVTAAPGPFILKLQPFISGRDYHSLITANDAIHSQGSFEDGVFRLRPYPGVSELFISVPGAEYTAQPLWYYDFEYPVEKERGLDFREDLFTPGFFSLHLQANSSLAVIISTTNPTGRDAWELQATEKQRRTHLIQNLPHKTELPVQLTLAADQFLVQRFQGQRSILAGYHWFTEWTRDTLIALPGITLSTGRPEIARDILKAYTYHLSQGMLPNRFSEFGEPAEYNSVDAALWLFIASYEYWLCTSDTECIVQDVLPELWHIIAAYMQETRYNIHMDKDHLIYAGSTGVQLTWMDAKVDDWVVTPRQGKAVEINALWYNALRILAKFTALCGQTEQSKHYEHDADLVQESFHRLFWLQEKQYLCDCIDGDFTDTSLRPNQIMALSLPFDLLSTKQAQGVLAAVENHLFTPVGLRSLSPTDPDYHPQYTGGPLERDSSYHQGTVWPWLLGPYLRALMRIKGSEGLEQTREILSSMSIHLKESGIGSISEIFDAEWPHHPRGCIAQAWSVAELLRVWTETELKKPE
ncbi:MAG: glycogen debranching enzyme family protein [Desulfovermiculus sp.]|nr:glycogen debranching enzyme family protein [Desulfovermiculus sp.]